MVGLLVSLLCLQYLTQYCGWPTPNRPAHPARTHISLELGDARQEVINTVEMVRLSQALHSGGGPAHMPESQLRAGYGSGQDQHGPSHQTGVVVCAGGVREVRVLTVQARVMTIQARVVAKHAERVTVQGE
jgi:hypothetical protein